MRWNFYLRVVAKWEKIDASLLNPLILSHIVNIMSLQSERHSEILLLPILSANFIVFTPPAPSFERLYITAKHQKIETSFCGLDIGTRSGLHLRGHDWKTIGESFCRTLLELLLPDSEIIKSAEAQLVHLAPDKFRGYGSSVGSARQEGDVDSGAVSDGSVPSKNERSGGTGSRSSKGKRHGSSTPKRVKSRRGSGNSSTDEAITKSSSGRARTSSGRNRLRKKSSSGKNK